MYRLSTLFLVSDGRVMSTFNNIDLLFPFDLFKHFIVLSENKDRSYYSFFKFKLLTRN